MRCERAAVIRYVTSPEGVNIAGRAIPEEEIVTLRIHAQVHRKLLTPDPSSQAWPDCIAAPFLEAGGILLHEEPFPVTPDPSLRREWINAAERAEELSTSWNSVVDRLKTAVPRPDLERLIETFVPAEERELSRFGRQVTALLALPEDAEGLRRCRGVLDQLTPWADTPQIVEAAEEYYRLATRMRETSEVVREALDDEFGSVAESRLAVVLGDAGVGLCRPQEQWALLDDTLFVFDGQYESAEMRTAMHEYLRDVRARMEQAATERDALRNDGEREHPMDIPDRVRSVVWQRDGGRCTVCGRTEDLEFDHVIPRSQGGASTARNVVVMCVRCNERKAAQVARVRNAGTRLRSRYNGTLDLFANEG